VYQAGWGKHDIGIAARGYAMHGYGMWHHRARGQQSALYARAFFVADESGRFLIFCCLDLGYVTHAMRAGVCARLRTELGDAFRDESLVLTCTHTHSGPGGCSHDALYNVVTPGFLPEHLEHVVEACTAAILQAHRSAAPTEIGLVQGEFDSAVPVAWNRSLRAYNRNPEVVPRRETETHLALNRAMQVLSLRREGQLRSLLSLFGVHATCVGNRLDKHDGDNKGYAAAHAEQALQAAGSGDAVAAFAQATAGDVSPHYHGPGQAARRKKIRGDAEYAYARRNGEQQSERALSLTRMGREESIDGGIDAVFSYVDFSDLKADVRYADGHTDAYTSEPCHGVAFFAGTPVDGPGLPKVLALVAGKIANAVRKRRLANLEKYSPDDQAYYRRLYAAQGPKAILLEAGRKEVLGRALDKLRLEFVDPSVKEMKRQARRGAIRKSALVPTVLPLQIITIGQIAVVCCPGEFTSTAGQRVIKTVQEELQTGGIAHVLICTYCNDYMGYVTTREEYLEQAYEGGHTIFGQWTLAAFQTRFADLARQLRKPEAERAHDRTTRPPPAPEDELALRSNLPVPD
jgi:neutral ceramidase